MCGTGTRYLCFCENRRINKNRRICENRTICKDRTAKAGKLQKDPIKKRDSVHSQKIARHRNFFWQKRQDKAGKKDRTEIVTESKQIRGFFSGKLAEPIHIAGSLCTHGESAQKSDDDHIETVIRQTKKREKKRAEQACKVLGKFHTNEDSGENHKRKERRNHPFKPGVQSGQRAGERCFWTG